MTASPLDFAWPSALLGRASGWAERRGPNQTMLHPPLGPRRPISLTPQWRAIEFAVGADGIVDPARRAAAPLLIKAPAGTQGIPGLSSGASSALMRQDDGSVLRLKRCGFADKGIGGRTGHAGRVGLMGLGEALQECRMLATFHAEGLSPACSPQDIHIVVDPKAPFFSDHAWATVRIRVTSDVRADEWLIKIIRDALEAAGLTPPYLVVQHDERLLFREFGAAVAAIRASRAYEEVALLGRGLGGLMRATHDAGYLRGRGSVWMGNDVVGPDLVLSAVDADGGAMLGERSLAVMKRIEVADYAAGFADCFSWGQPDWLAEPSAILFESFLEGYKTAAPPRVGKAPRQPPVA